MQWTLADNSIIIVCTCCVKITIVSSYIGTCIDCTGTTRQSFRTHVANGLFVIPAAAMTYRTFQNIIFFIMCAPEYISHACTHSQTCYPHEMINNISLSLTGDMRSKGDSGW